jgi:D-psicose/D-tagatose/L-ribulose 3-epimerase
MTRHFAASVWIWSAGMSGNDAENQALLEKISNIGFDGVEIPSLDGNLNPTKIREDLASLGRIGRDLYPVIIGGGTPETDLSSESSSTRSQGVSYVKKLIDVCREIEGDLVCGPLYSAVGVKKYLSETERSKIVDIVGREFRALGKYAQDRSVRLALEPLCRYDTHLINTVFQGKELVEKIDLENVGLLLDTFHLNIEEKSIENAILHAGEKLFHFHACENDRGPPGTGHIDWQGVKEALDTLNYQRWVAIESFVPDRGQFSSAMNIWRHIAKNQDEIAVEGLEFLKDLLG